jgi:hypothetical protein
VVSHVCLSYFVQESEDVGGEGERDVIIVCLISLVMS